MKRCVGLLISLILVTLLTPTAELATAAKPLCDPDKRRAARVLTQADVPEGANLSGADLRCGSYGAIRFVNVNLDRAQLDGADIGALTNVSADSASFVNALIRPWPGGASGASDLSMSGSFRNANLSGATFFVNGKVILDGANMTKAKVTLANSDPGSSYLRADFTMAKFSAFCRESCGNFTGAVMKNLRGVRVSLLKSTLVGVNFSGARLRRADFTNTDLTRANFAGSQLQGATFYGALVDGTKFKGSKGKTFGVGKSN